MTNTEWTTTTKHIVAVGLVLFGLYVLYLSRSVIALVVIAALIAFLLMPLVDFFQRRLKLPRGVAVLLTYVVGIILLLLAPLVFVPPIIDGFNFLAGIDPEVLAESILRWAENTLLSLKNLNLPIIGLSLDPWIDRALIALREAETGAADFRGCFVIILCCRTILTGPAAGDFSVVSDPATPVIAGATAACPTGRC